MSKSVTTSSYTQTSRPPNVPEQIGDYEVHPVASLFPLLEGEAYLQLKKSLEDHGQQQPIIRSKGVLLDGRNRLKILLELGKQPVFEEYEGRLSADEYILTANLFRRHLTDGQRTMIVTETLLWKKREEARKRKQKAGEQHGKGRPKVHTKSYEANDAPETGDQNARTTVGQIAEAAKVSHHKAAQAIAVSDHAPELVPQVRKGEVPLRRAAAVARQRAPHPKRLPRNPEPKPIIIDVTPAVVAPPTDGSALPADYIDAKHKLLEGIHRQISGLLVRYKPYRKDLLYCVIHEVEQFIDKKRAIAAADAATGLLQ
jgi:ParB-like chromosome segregation protein Spo0J